MTSAVGPHHPSAAHLCAVCALPHPWDSAHMLHCAQKAAAERRSEGSGLGGQLKPKATCKPGDLGWCVNSGGGLGKNYKILKAFNLRLPRNIHTDHKGIWFAFCIELWPRSWFSAGGLLLVSLSSGKMCILASPTADELRAGYFVEILPQLPLGSGSLEVLDPFVWGINVVKGWDLCVLPKLEACHWKE